jgi:hypothetical protein
VNHLSSWAKIKAVHFWASFPTRSKFIGASLERSLAFTQQFLEARVVVLTRNLDEQAAHDSQR